MADLSKYVGGMQMPTELTVYKAASTGYTLDVAHAFQEGLCYTGTDTEDGTIDANVGAVTDITDPANTGGWTTIFEKTSTKMLVQLQATSSTHLQLTVHSNETSGDALRGQILIDDEIILDFTCTGDNANTRTNYLCIIRNDTNYSEPLPCNSSFKMQVAREGSFADVGSSVRTAGIFYREVK